MGSARREYPGSTPVAGVGESVSLSRTSAEERLFRRGAETRARDGRAPQSEGARYWKRRLPHFEKPWAVYAIAMTTRWRRSLSPRARTIVLNAVTYFHNSRYELFAACVMPDHVHLLFQPWPKGGDPSNNAVFWSIPELMHSLKSFTAHEINKVEKSHGPVWEEEVFDRYIRSEADLHEKFRYICRNPWAAGVAQCDEHYPWLWTPDISRGRDPGSTPVAGVGESVSLSRTSAELVSAGRRNRARDGRAPQTVNAPRAMKSSMSTRPLTPD